MRGASCGFQGYGVATGGGRAAARPDPPATRPETQGRAKEKVDSALLLFDEIAGVTKDASTREANNPLLRRLGVRLGLDFAEGHKKARPVRKLVGGVLVFGDADLPVPRYGENNRDDPNRSPK